MSSADMTDADEADEAGWRSGSSWAAARARGRGRCREAEGDGGADGVMRDGAGVTEWGVGVRAAVARYDVECGLR